MFLFPDEFKIETFYKNKSTHKITDTEELGVDCCLAFMRRIINDKIDLVKNNKLWNILDMTPKEKAEELVEKFSDLEDGEMYIGKAKRCALITLDEIISIKLSNILCGLTLVMVGSVSATPIL